MEAYRADRPGGLDSLIRTAVELPEPGPGQLRVAVRGAGVHLADVAALAGQRRPRPSLPFTPGFEISGRVEAMGMGVTGFAPGQSVVAFLSSGGLAEQALVQAALAVPLPDGLAFGRAAGLPLAYAGGLVALRDRAALGPGQTLLVLGAGGQAGLAAVELGKRLGADVIATAGKEARLEVAAAQGADHTVDSAARPIGEAAMELTDGRGVDVVFDPVGGDGSLAALPALAQGGRIICAGFAAGRAPTLNAMALYARDASFVAANVAVMIEAAPESLRAALGDVVQWAARGEIRPRVAAHFPFDQAHHALDYVMNRRDSGAVVVTVNGN